MIVYSFFFSYFPSDHGEYKMWKIFRRWESVIDVFIAKKVNQRGHKFGFVRYQGVTNVESLEKSLDNIWIRNTKIYVNRHKYKRYDNL